MQLRRKPPGRSPKWLLTRIRIPASSAAHKVRKELLRAIPEANKIAATPYDFEGKNLTAYGGLLPVATMLEKLGFQQVVEETLRVKRVTRAMSLYQFVLAMVLARYVGFSRLHHLRFLPRRCWWGS